MAIASPVGDRALPSFKPHCWILQQAPFRTYISLSRIHLPMFPSIPVLL
jgi:hypothetical protein